MQIIRTILSGRSPAGIAVRAAAAAACAFFLVGCNTDQQITGAPDVSADYRMRHPITLQEADRTLELLIGSNRGELNPTQRAQVLSFGIDWKRDATGGIVVSRPIGATNERAAADAMTEIVSILSAAGMPPQSIVVQTYPATAPTLAPIHIRYPRIRAQAGPCGLWPQDIGPSMNRDFFENQPPWNYGCAAQRNLAAEVDNPADLVQPRAETPAYAARRTLVLEKYRAGQNPSTEDSANTQAAKITDVGK
jgi:pilus assembly protein CpaD